MKIQVYGRRKISSIQEDFATAFPYLRIEFFSWPKKNGNINSRKPFKNSELKLSDCNLMDEDKKVIITDDMTVMKLEQLVHDKLGIGVQVYRKSGKVWLETTVTDGWTLKEQNDQGMELSKKH
jgi:hypothetical protein